MAETPPLRVTETAGHCRLSLAGLAYGTGATLQDAADDLVLRVLALVNHVRAGAVFGLSTAVPRPDERHLELLRELAEVAERGGDIRARLLWPA